MNNTQAVANTHSAGAPVYVVLDNVRSALNVGSVFRTMDAFACAGIYLCGITASPPHREINKTALGASHTVPWQHCKHTADALLTLRDKGVELIAIEQCASALSLQTFNPVLERPVAFVFGNEVTGVSAEALAACERALHLPQHGSKQSLNIAVCAGIVLWHATHKWNYAQIHER